MTIAHIAQTRLHTVFAINPLQLPSSSSSYSFSDSPPPALLHVDKWPPQQWSAVQRLGLQDKLPVDKFIRFLALSTRSTDQFARNKFRAPTHRPLISPWPHIHCTLMNSTPGRVMIAVSELSSGISFDHSLDLLLPRLRSMEFARCVCRALHSIQVGGWLGD